MSKLKTACEVTALIICGLWLGLMAALVVVEAQHGRAPHSEVEWRQFEFSEPAPDLFHDGAWAEV